VVWEEFFSKSDKQGGSRFEREARVGKMLEADYRNGGVIVDYLQRGDAQMSRNTRDADVAKANRTEYDNAAEAIIAKRAATILRKQGKPVVEGTPEYSRAVRMVLEADEPLYRDYEDQQAVIAKNYGKFNDALPGKPTTDDTDDDDDDDEDGEDREKRRKSITAIGKALTDGALVLIRKGGGTFRKLCSCGAENKVNADKCGDCGKKF
jgi:hypothetical protein